MCREECAGDTNPPQLQAPLHLLSSVDCYIKTPSISKARATILARSVASTGTLGLLHTLTPVARLRASM